MAVVSPLAAAEPRSVTILGSTGSVGCSTVDLIERNPGVFRVEALTGNANVERLAAQARRLRARLAVVGDVACYPALKMALAGSGIEAAAGSEALIEAASRPAQWVMSAIVGAAGLGPTLAAVRRGAMVALANKECLVSAGAVMMAEIERSGAVLLPVDSEHSAIFQVLDFDKPECIERIILTASGGPFLRMPAADMARVTCEQAVAHPNWSMGAKISVDSATMMNKGLELIEAFHLFPVEADRIDILVHPQSVIHSMVAYVDGSVLAQLGTPDMRTPIAFALGWPKRMAAPAKRLSLAEIGTLTFEDPDPGRFPSLRLAREALQSGGAATTILNAANEVAVHSFLEREIGFLDIARVVERTLGAAANGPVRTLEDVQAADADAREIARGFVSRLSGRL
ncbi:MAG: 1-deoxy-D-xylulose-5-phosphate reductoisomerase [Rhodospirillales bacterium]|nr:1-deoxy-D-xylulose-5-phosphate reductoisomerase [Rhodospirillales bacterium]